MSGLLRRRTVTLHNHAKDPWPAEVKRQMDERDQRRCIGRVVGFPTICSGGLERDHIRASGGLGMKSRSTLDNGVLLCSMCHQWKTLHGRDARPLLIDYVDRMAAGAY